MKVQDARVSGCPNETIGAVGKTSTLRRHHAGGRFGLTAVALALAGRFAAQGRKEPTIGTLPCDTIMFAVLVLGAVVLVGALCFLPALVVGPIAEHLQP
jgi:K+-transporting ATPase A subunit